MATEWYVKNGATEGVAHHKAMVDVQSLRDYAEQHAIDETPQYWLRMLNEAGFESAEIVLRRGLDVVFRAYVPMGAN